MKIYNRLLTLLTLSIMPLLAWSAEEKVTLEAFAEVKKSGYVGEALEYSIILKSNSPNIANIRVAEAPSIPEEIEVLRGAVNNQRPKEVMEKGRRTYQWTVQREFLIPKSPGKYTVGEWKFIAFLPVERVVNDWFWGARRVVEYEEYPVSCKAASIKIERLPDNKTGLEFSGCVGEFTIEGWFPPGNINAGSEAIAIFTISGYGSLANLTVPNISRLFNKGCRLKSIDQDEKQSQRDGRLFSEVTLVCTFMPETPGFEIDPLRMLFFNPMTKKYETVESDALHWNGTDSEGKRRSSKTNDAIQI